MIKMKSRILVMLITVFTLFSCEKKFNFEDYDVALANLFSGYGDDLEKDIYFLNKKIN